MKGKNYDLKRVKRTMQNASREINLLVERENKLINQRWSLEELRYLDAIYAYKRYNADLMIKPNRRTQLQENKQQICKYLRDILHVYDTDWELCQLMDIVENRAKEMIGFIEDFQLELCNIYTLYDEFLYHVSALRNLDYIEAIQARENMYCNEYDEFIFATSDYEQLILFLCRATAGSMMVFADNSVCIFPKEPFGDCAGKYIMLAKIVSMYALPAKYFMPVVDFKLETSGVGILKFGFEWTSKNKSLKASETEIDRIPLEDFYKHTFYIQASSIDSCEIGEICKEKENAYALSDVLKDLSDKQIISKVSR